MACGDVMTTGTTTNKPQQTARTLPDSINGESRLTLTIGGVRGWQTFKGVFLSRCEASQTFRTALKHAADRPSNPDARPGDQVGVTYRVGNRKCMFSSPLVSLVWHATGGDVVLGWPDKVHHLRRRCFDRAAPPRGKAVTVRLTDGAAASSSAPPEVREGRLLDISVGGLRLAVVDVRPFELGATYRCAFTACPGWDETLFDAIVRHCGRDDNGQPVLGLQIVGLETLPDSSQAMDRLARAVAYFQQAASHGKR